MADQLLVTDYDPSVDPYLSPIPGVSFAQITPDSASAPKRRNVATDGAGNWVVSGHPNGQSSQDDGATWADTVLTPFFGSNAFGVDSVVWTGDRFLAAGFVSGGSTFVIATSIDGGATWEQIHNVGLLNTVAGFARIGTDPGALWVTLRHDDLNPAPSASTRILYHADPPTGPFTAGDPVARDWDVGAGAFGVGNQYTMPRPLAGNDSILLAFSVNDNDIEWTEDPTDASPMTAGTHTGTGQIWCAIYDGAGWIGGGQYDDAGTLKFSWAESADGKAWTHHNEPTLGRWCLVDAFFDGSSAWFAAIHTDAGDGAVFEWDGAAWTRHDLPGSSTSGFGIAGFPFDPVLEVIIAAGLSGSVDVSAVVVAIIYAALDPGTVDVSATVGATRIVHASLSANVDASGTVDEPVRVIPAVLAGTVEAAARVTFARRFGLIRRTRLCSTTGEGFAELENAVQGPITWVLDEPTSFSIDLGISDPKAYALLVEKFRELQLWVGDWLAIQGPAITPSADEKTIAVSGAGPDWYLDRRIIGRPSSNLLENGDFSEGLAHWSVLVTDENFGLHGATADAYATVEGPPLTSTYEGDRRTLVIVDETFPSPNDHRAPYVYQEVELTAGPFGLEVFFEALCFTTGEGFAQDPPVGIILARLPLNYRDLPYPGTGAPLPPSGLGNQYWAAGSVVEPDGAIASSSLDDTHPRGLYLLHRVSVTIPPGETEIIHCRMNGRAATATRWSRAGLFTDEALEFFRTDVSVVVADLVAHAQDPAFDQSDVNLDAINPPTGVIVDRRYPFKDRYKVLEAIKNLAAEGLLDYSVEVTPTSRNLTLDAPRRAWPTSIVLELGRNVSGFAWAFDGESASSMIAVLPQTNDTGPGRPEGSAIDTTDFAGGLTLQDVLAAPFGTPVSALDSFAAEILKTVKNPHTLALKLNAAGRDLIGRLFPGHVVPVVIRRGALEIVGTYRVVRVTLTPDNFLELVVNEEPSP